jgi:hypothetical protein
MNPDGVTLLVRFNDIADPVDIQVIAENGRTGLVLQMANNPHTFKSMRGLL